MTVRIAMWSGPRNLSTAMMYSFASRSDCVVVDEPFYAAYLAKTGLDHPMRREILASQPVDPLEACRQLMGPVDAPIQYQKQMTHHILPGFPLDWVSQVKNVFLIRHPARVVSSYAKKREGPSLEDLGFRQQRDLFFRSKNSLVIDATDIRAEPERMLRKLCEAIEIDWQPAMLRWPRGGHPSDGVWAAHWYGAVHQSSGFASAEGQLPELDADYADLAKAAMPYYEEMAAHKIT